MQRLACSCLQSKKCEKTVRNESHRPSSDESLEKHSDCDSAYEKSNSQTSNSVKSSATSGNSSEPVIKEVSYDLKNSSNIFQCENNNSKSSEILQRNLQLKIPDRPINKIKFTQGSSSKSADDVLKASLMRDEQAYFSESSLSKYSHSTEQFIQDKSKLSYLDFKDYKEIERMKLQLNDRSISSQNQSFSDCSHLNDNSHWSLTEKNESTLSKVNSLNSTNSIWIRKESDSLSFVQSTPIVNDNLLKNNVNLPSFTKKNSQLEQISITPIENENKLKKNNRIQDPDYVSHHTCESTDLEEAVIE